MYSRYDDYKPFDPMSNRLSSSEERRGRDSGTEARRHERPSGEDRRDAGHEHHETKARERKGGGLLGINGGFGKLLKNFKIDLKSDDILILLILLFLSQESDDDEILLILGLYLFMSGQ